MHGGHVWLWEERALDNSWHATHIIPLSQSLSLSIPDSSFTFLQHSSRISWCRQYRPHSCREKQRESVYVCGRKSKTAFFVMERGFLPQTIPPLRPNSTLCSLAYRGSQESNLSHCLKKSNTWRMMFDSWHPCFMCSRWQNNSISQHAPSKKTPPPQTHTHNNTPNKPVLQSSKEFHVLISIE